MLFFKYIYIYRCLCIYTNFGTPSSLWMVFPYISFVDVEAHIVAIELCDSTCEFEFFTPCESNFHVHWYFHGHRLFSRP